VIILSPISLFFFFFFIYIYFADFLILLAVELYPLLTNAQRECVSKLTIIAHSCQHATKLAFEAIGTNQRLRDKFHYTISEDKVPWNRQGKPLMIKKKKKTTPNVSRPRVTEPGVAPVPSSKKTKKKITQAATPNIGATTTSGSQNLEKGEDSEALQTILSFDESLAATLFQLGMDAPPSEPSLLVEDVIISSEPKHARGMIKTQLFCPTFAQFLPFFF
jgi:hypothetical protein